ncbi:MAG: cysteine desulfurase-like protein [Nannocystis sp.]|nr:cysteine desulfurase-like protein [Nannocystis sp.]
MLDAEFVRSHFPALARGCAFFDNAGGTFCPVHVRDRITEHLSANMVQLGATHPLSREATQTFQAGRDAAARLVGADPSQVILGPSTTANLITLASALRPLWRAGDAVVVTDLDHESNIGPWRRLAATGIELREWRLNPSTHALEPDDLRPLLDDRVRLVAFTHSANVVGAIHDVEAITDLAHRAGAQVCVDGVAYAPHRHLDLPALGVDYYALSLYKVFGPHLALLYGKHEHLRAARPPAHFFYGEGDLPHKFEPGGAPHELVAGLPGILDYLDALDQHHFGQRGDAAEAPLARIFGLIAAHESRLAARLLDLLHASPKVTVLGPPTADPARRLPLIAFTLRGRHASELPPLLDPHGVALRWGHFYAPRAVDRLGLTEVGGVIRVSMAHYNDDHDLDRLIAALTPHIF